MRTFHFTVDPLHARSANERTADVRRLQVSAGIVGALVIAGCVALVIVQGGAAWSIYLAIAFGILGLGSFALIPVIPRKTGTLQHTYDTSELVPAVIADVRERGMTLLALVDAAVDRARGSQPALCAVDVQEVHGSPRSVGERVPCVAVCGNRTRRVPENRWQMITPMPIAWGTRDATVVADARKAISPAEWTKLQGLIGRVQDVRTARERILVL